MRRVFFVLVCFFLNEAKSSSLIQDFSHKSQIPQVIHQTYIDQKSLSPRALACISSLKRRHKEFQYEFWSDERMYAFVHEYYPQYESKFLALPRKIMQIDIFRLMLLYIHGGVYCDIDYRFFKSMAPWIKNCDLFLPLAKKPFGLGNALMASSPRHVFWKLVIDDFFSNQIVSISQMPNGVAGDEFVLHNTGPAFITRMYKKYKNKMKQMGYIPKIPYRIFFHPHTYERTPKASVCKHECHGTWRGKSS